MRKLLPLLFQFILLVTLKAQDQPMRLGFALSGGGAKGLAHIGVLKVLEEHGIYPDLVTGTSMGSIVGGLYTIGYSPEELRIFATELTWDDYFNDTYPRAFLPVEEKARADRYQLTFALENGKLKLPRGLIQGKKIQTLLAGLTAPAHSMSDFDSFCLPFRCVATDLETGEAVVFSSGPLRRAIRASMSIPSAFEPVEYGERLLVDGLVVRNLPVQDAFDMGADIVLGVDVGSPLYEREDITSVLTVLDQTSSFGSAASTQRQRELADFLITPDLGGYSTLSYDMADSLILRGEEAARKALPELKAMLDSLGFELPMANRRCRQQQRDSFLVTDVSFQGDASGTRRTLDQLFHAHIPRTFTVQQLSDEISRLYASGFFKLVDYELQPLSEGYRLVLTASAAPAWYVRGSINYDTDYKAALLLNLTGRNLGLRGAILSADFRVSENPAVLLDYLIYTRSSPSIGLKWHGGFSIFPGRIYEDWRLADEFSFHHFNTRLSFISGISRRWSMEGGLFAERLSQNLKFFSRQNDQSFSEQIGMFLKLSRDTYDRTYFPTDGSLTSLRAQWTFGGKIKAGDGDTPRDIPLADNIMITARLHKVFPLGEHWWISWINGAGIVNYRQRHFLNQLYLGREVPGEELFYDIMGLRFMELPVTAFAGTGLQLRTRMTRSTFIGLTYNTLWHASSESRLFPGALDTGEYTSGWFNGLGLELGGLTTFGPLRFTTEYNLDLGRFNFSMTAGYRF